MQISSHSARWKGFGERRFDERIISFCITFTFLFYLLGALYLVAPIVGWALAARALSHWSMYQPHTVQNSHWLIILWLIGAGILEFALIIGHLNFDLGLSKIIKSTIGWAKGWALLSLFILLGFLLHLRYQVICRAACIVGLVAILITPLAMLAFLLGLPQQVYVSPLKILGGAGPEFFTVMLYEIDPGTGLPRWRYFAPWAPAVGFVANIYFLCSWFERNLNWRIVGLVGNALMVVLAVSRMGMIVMLLVPLLVWGLSRLTRPWIMFVAAACVLSLAIFFEPLSHALLSLLEDVKSARADSTRVRAALANIALYRWQSEAFWFGHGVVEPGTHLVEFMPIGSHHNWYGLLFVKGVVGLLSFLIPFVLTCCVLLVKAQYQVSSRLALGMCFIVGFFSLSENIEALAYMTWPCWLLIGVGLRSTIEDIDTYRHNLFGQFRLLSEEHRKQPSLAV